MRLRNVAIVYRKEMLDTLRDRRTLISMILVPLLLMPVLIVGMAALSIKLLQRAQQQVATIMILGAEYAPAAAEHIRQAEGFQVAPAASDYVQHISDKKLRAAVEFPAGFEQALTHGERPTVKLYHYAGEMRSQFAVRNLQNVLNEYRDEVVAKRLATRQLSPDVLQPFETAEENVAPPEKVGGSLFGGLIPYIIILLSLTGAMYPAIDLTAGEKERGTIETILASPVARSELVVGKFLTVMTASVSTAALSLASLAATYLATPKSFAQMGRAGASFQIAISGKGVAAVLLMILPVAVMFAAALLAIAVLARSYKEAQSYISPLMIVVILPAVASLLPGIELDARLAFVPILNVSLVSKEILTGTYHWHYIGLIFASSCVYAAAALFVAVRAFQRESVLFRT